MTLLLQPKKSCSFLREPPNIFLHSQQNQPHQPHQPHQPPLSSSPDSTLTLALQWLSGDQQTEPDVQAFLRWHATTCIKHHDSTQLRSLLTKLLPRLHPDRCSHPTLNNWFGVLRQLREHLGDFKSPDLSAQIRGHQTLGNGGFAFGPWQDFNQPVLSTQFFWPSLEQDLCRVGGAFSPVATFMSFLVILQTFTERFPQISLSTQRFQSLLHMVQALLHHATQGRGTIQDFEQCLLKTNTVVRTFLIRVLVQLLSPTLQHPTFQRQQAQAQCNFAAKLILPPPCNRQPDEPVTSPGPLFCLWQDKTSISILQRVKFTCYDARLFGKGLVKELTQFLPPAEGSQLFLPYLETLPNIITYANQRLEYTLEVCRQTADFISSAFQVDPKQSPPGIPNWSLNLDGNTVLWQTSLASSSSSIPSQPPTTLSTSTSPSDKLQPLKPRFPLKVHQQQPNPQPTLTLTTVQKVSPSSFTTSLPSCPSPPRFNFEPTTDFSLSATLPLQPSTPHHQAWELPPDSPFFPSLDDSNLDDPPFDWTNLDSDLIPSQADDDNQVASLYQELFPSMKEGLATLNELEMPQRQETSAMEVVSSSPSPPPTLPPPPASNSNPSTRRKSRITFSNDIKEARRQEIRARFDPNNKAKINKLVRYLCCLNDQPHTTKYPTVIKEGRPYFVFTKNDFKAILKKLNIKFSNWNNFFYFKKASAFGLDHLQTRSPYGTYHPILETIDGGKDRSKFHLASCVFSLWPLQ